MAVGFVPDFEAFARAVCFYNSTTGTRSPRQRAPQVLFLSARLNRKAGLFGAAGLQMAQWFQFPFHSCQITKCRTG